jgi:acyl-CoA thioester hydrolase
MTPRIPAGFSFHTDVTVRFAETDAQGVAHHANYLVWFELARVAYLAEHAGGYNSLREQGLEALVVEAHVRYGVAARFDVRLRIHARVRDVRGARFRYEYAVTRGDELVAEGWTGHACVDPRTFRPTRIPPSLKDAIAKAEGRVQADARET